jgi:hypothetical protein
VLLQSNFIEGFLPSMIDDPRHARIKRANPSKYNL